jgi:UDP-N-acetyl-D-galactosamine dehydrogenase
MFDYKPEIKDSFRVAIIGLGYVGLPLLCHFATKYQCVGLDINEQRILQLSHGIDSKKCINPNMLSSLKNVMLTSDWMDLRDCNFLIVTAPTPIDGTKQPDLHSLKDICAQLGKVIKRGDIIIFESTVAPGTTEELCVPIIEETSSLILNEDFAVGYSPERINIGDATHTLSNVPKIVSSSNPDSLNIISDLYHAALGCEIVTASSIKTAEAAKLYENVQRDVLIALANQYSEYCKAEGIDIREVTQCASTKWNFAEVYPGLVGGHYIGVDPYYLISRAKGKDLYLELVEKAREINESETDKAISAILTTLQAKKANSVLLVGLTYKPDTSDVRNSKAIEIAKNIAIRMKGVSIYDPNIRPEDLPTEIRDIYCSELQADYIFDAVVTLVKHSAVITPLGKIVNLNINK